MKRSSLSNFSVMSVLAIGAVMVPAARADGPGPAPAAGSSPIVNAPPVAAPSPATVTAPSGMTASAPVQRSMPRVEIFEFTPVDKAANPAEWIGKGIRENLQSDVSKTGATLVLPTHPVNATEDQIASAKTERADLAVTGTYQIIGDQIRVNAHLIDVASNTAAGGFSATGSQRDLFQVEDALGEQFRRLLPRPAAVASSQVPANQPPSQPGYQPQPEVVNASPPTVIYDRHPFRRTLQHRWPPTNRTTITRVMALIMGTGTGTAVYIRSDFTVGSEFMAVPTAARTTVVAVDIAGVSIQSTLRVVASAGALAVVDSTAVAVVGIVKGRLNSRALDVV